jgi:outer membrane immunogenic protein
MRRKFLLGMGLLAFAAAGGGSAVAADIAARPVGPPPAPAAPAFISDWAGFYIGINGGGGWAHESFEPSLFFLNTPLLTTPPGTSPKGGIFGFQAGHNWQWGPVVGGLEVDFDGADLTSSTSFFPVVPGTLATMDKKIDELASVRARLGYLIFPNWLLYGTTGVGFGHDRIATTVSTFPVPLLEASQTTDINMFGWVVGAGLEYKFFNNWLIRGEWLHYDFGRVTDPSAAGFLNSTILIDTGNIRTTVDVARAALSYKF